MSVLKNKLLAAARGGFHGLRQANIAVVNRVEQVIIPALLLAEAPESSNHV